MAATIIGDNGPNNLTGTDQRDHIFAKGGDDTVNALARADWILAGDGNDTVNAGHGADRVFGSGGNDALDGGIGHDSVRGGEGDDAIKGGGGFPGRRGDKLHGNAGNDNIEGGGGYDLITGNAGLDTLNARRWMRSHLAGARQRHCWTAARAKTSGAFARADARWRPETTPPHGGVGLTSCRRLRRRHPERRRRIRQDLRQPGSRRLGRRQRPRRPVGPVESRT